MQQIVVQHDVSIKNVNRQKTIIMAAVNRQFLLQSLLLVVILLKRRQRIKAKQIRYKTKRKHRFWVRKLFKEVLMLLYLSSASLPE